MDWLLVLIQAILGRPLDDFRSSKVAVRSDGTTVSWRQKDSTKGVMWLWTQWRLSVIAWIETFRDRLWKAFRSGTERVPKKPPAKNRTSLE